MRLATSSASACVAASAGSSASRSRAASSASPTRPAAFRRGASANAMVSRSMSAGAIRARSRSAAIPGRGARRICSRPNRAIDRFSPTIGATSATVPMVARSARASAAAGPPGSSARTSCATLKATPLPARRTSGYRESARCGLTTATAGGRVAGSRWWSVTITSMPRSAATEISVAELDPVSTVTMTRTPFRSASSTAAIDRPCPSSSRLGTYGSTVRP